MRRAEREALALGLLHGPVELVPVSSSGHIAAIPWLLGWEVAGWDGERRKELEVALHAGTALALLLVARPERVRPRLLAAAVLPPAIAGLAFERPIERRLGKPPTLAAGLLAGALALVLADRSPGSRAADDAGMRDGLALGLAQATALIPGVSRSGATLAAARALGFSRADASRLAWEVALPVLLGAGGLKAWRVARAAVPPRTSGTVRAGAAGPHASIPSDAARAGAAGPYASTPSDAARAGAAGPRAATLCVGAGAAFGSTLATAGAIGIERRAPLWPWAAWRAGLAAAILAVRENRGR
jgi:undecaprenyl-diphosphatase